MSHINTEKGITTRILRKKDILQLTGLSHSTLYRMMHEGKFPKPLRLTPGTVGWTSDSISSWIRGLEQVKLGMEEADI